jgi:hypothetical protein
MSVPSASDRIDISSNPRKIVFDEVAAGWPSCEASLLDALLVAADVWGLDWTVFYETISHWLLYMRLHWDYLTTAAAETRLYCEFGA